MNKIKPIVLIFITLQYIEVLHAQTNIVFGPNFDVRHTLWSDNLEYIRNPYGSNTGMGGHLIISKDKIGLKLSYNAYKEEYRDIVKEDVRFFEYFDTITYKTRLRYMGLGISLNIINKRFTLHYEGDVMRSQWQKTDVVGFAPNKKVIESFTGKEKQFKPGLHFRNGLKMGYTMGKFELTSTIFTDVLLRRYWNHNNYMGSIEPYPRAAMGGSVGLGYKISLKK